METKELQELKQYLKRIENYTLLAAKNVLCFDDAVLLTGLSRSHLYRLTCTNQIPHYKPNGKLLYFDRGELETWLKQNRVATEQEIEMRAATYVTTGRMKKGDNQ